MQDNVQMTKKPRRYFIDEQKAEAVNFAAGFLQPLPHESALALS
ncbi:hypothetical protein Lepto7375DRAFT_8282 [Leptolyngbya sp. PCC 7375]|nr:hypothetical protein Lepto7375DRAFT_8282 [Leptolyngbya sp. PCC 7375]